MYCLIYISPDDLPEFLKKPKRGIEIYVSSYYDKSIKKEGYERPCIKHVFLIWMEL